MIRNYGALDFSFSNFVVASGLQDKIILFRASGRNPDVDTVADEDVWNVGGTITLPTTASTVSIVSTSADDADGGSGLHAVYLFGLDANWDILPIERIALNGITPVVSTQSYIRVFAMQGTINNPPNPQVVAAGNITASIGGNAQLQISTGETVESSAITVIPNGYTGFLDVVYAAGAATQNFIVTVALRREGDIFISGPPIEVAGGTFSALQFDGLTTPAPGRSDIKVRARSLGQNAAISASLSMIAVRNDYLASLAESV